MSAKLIPLSMWAERRYSEPPSSRTLRRWADDGKIYPCPKKEGGTWWVPENAIYSDPADPDYAAMAAVHEQAS